MGSKLPVAPHVATLRKGLHECTAQAIEALYAQALDQHYSELAHHYSRSGNTHKAEEGIVQMRRGLDTARTIGTENESPYFLALLAEAHGKVGRIKEAFNLLVEALETGSRTGEREYEAELYRLKGQLTLQSQSSPRQVKTDQDMSEDAGPRPLAPDPQADAEACFLKAIEIARPNTLNRWNYGP